MPIHDWKRVNAGVFHHFHNGWIQEIARFLNRGHLPRGYYALSEQITGSFGPDVLTLQRPDDATLPAESGPDGGVAVAVAPPKVRFHARAEIDMYADKTVVIRHRSRHQIIAMVEIVSPGNKNSHIEFAAFVHKAQQALRSGVHLLIVDLFPPTARDPQGIHRAIWSQEDEGDFALPEDKPLTCASYLGCPGAEVYLEPVAVGEILPDMPLFLSRNVYAPIPLEATYQMTWEGLPDFLRDVLTAPPGQWTQETRTRPEEVLNLARRIR